MPENLTPELQAMLERLIQTGDEFNATLKRTLERCEEVGAVIQAIDAVYRHGQEPPDAD